MKDVLGRLDNLSFSGGQVLYSLPRSSPERFSLPQPFWFGSIVGLTQIAFQNVQGVGGGLAARATRRFECERQP